MLVCTGAAGSADLTLLQARAYQVFRVMMAMRFSRPLPWTSKPLYDWFTLTVRGVRFIPPKPGQAASCCGCDGLIEYGTKNLVDLKILEPARWLDPTASIGS